VNLLVRDWQIWAVLRYQSGLPILAPAATNGLSSILGRFDPNASFILNPAAWSQPAAGQYAGHLRVFRRTHQISSGVTGDKIAGATG
jgi:hypothetical protein